MSITRSSATPRAAFRNGGLALFWRIGRTAALLLGLVPTIATPLTAQAGDATEHLLAELADAPGPPGFEGPAAEVLIRYIKPYADRIERDKLGSVIAVQRGTADGPRIMVDAHLDEVGFLVTDITEQGYLKFRGLGGWFDQILLSQRVAIRTRNGEVLGVIGSKPPHLLKGEERSKVVEMDRMFIDIGASSEAEAKEKLGVRLGDPIVPATRFTRLGDGKLYLAKAWDDRAGCALLVEVMRRLKEMPHPNTVYAVGACQEEVGLRGTHTAVTLVEPDIGISLDVGIAGDSPDVSPEEARQALGKGPVITLWDYSMMPNVRLRDFVTDLGDELKIPYQVDFVSGGQDGAEIQRSKEGVPALYIGIPARYIHSSNSLIHRDDIDNIARLVAETIVRLDAATVRRIGEF